LAISVFSLYRSRLYQYRRGRPLVDLHSFALLLAYAGSAVGVAMVAPQIVRTVTHPHLGGVSPWSWAITAVACSLWLTYGLRSGSMPQVPGNVLLVSGAAAIVLLVPAGWSRARRAWTLLGVTGTLVLFSTYLSPEQVGFFAFGIGLFAAWPQLFETVWLRRGQGPSALSMSSQVLKVVGQVLWLCYAVLAVDAPVIVAAVVALTCNAVIATVEASRRRAARVPESELDELEAQLLAERRLVHGTT
jgi:uncharacterized protein with PQ loop repeat